MTTSGYTCGDCGFIYQIELEGSYIQPCPRCGSQEMVKAPKSQDIKEK